MTGREQPELNLSILPLEKQHLLLCPSEFVVVPIWFSDFHKFEKPNDEKALNLVNTCAAAILEEYPDIVFSYRFRDEYRECGGKHVCPLVPRWCSGDGLSARTVAMARIGHSTAGREPLWSRPKRVATLVAPSHPF
ncbi:hypothetical protein RHMOL_Rhmol06G0127400 [Rhododendron molle]|uniref:Uncharacterized protein n=1 Tax=Rhododendron molle TaxID=49168 RepID=A0ACC0NBJ0_RHOML|nr:hypothetical protein RHMOL_Rhmol06G0127400 [Rhododendron molle]